MSQPEPPHEKFDLPSLREAEQQMRLVLMGTGSMTLDQVNRHAPGLTRAVVGAYLSELRFHQLGFRPSQAVHLQTGPSSVRCGVHPRAWGVGDVTADQAQVTCRFCLTGVTR